MAHSRSSAYLGNVDDCRTAINPWTTCICFLVNITPGTPPIPSAPKFPPTRTSAPQRPGLISAACAPRARPWPPGRPSGAPLWWSVVVTCDEPKGSPLSGGGEGGGGWGFGACAHNNTHCKCFGVDAPLDQGCTYRDLSPVEVAVLFSRVRRIGSLCGLLTLMTVCGVCEKFPEWPAYQDL